MLLLYCILNANLNDTALCMVKLTSVTSRVSADISTAIMSLSSSLSAGQGRPLAGWKYWFKSGLEFHHKISGTLYHFYHLFLLNFLWTWTHRGHHLAHSKSPCNCYKPFCCCKLYWHCATYSTYFYSGNAFSYPSFLHILLGKQEISATMQWNIQTYVERKHIT